MSAPNIIQILGFRTAAELRAAAANFQLDGYATVQIGPTGRVLVEPGDPALWPHIPGEQWFVMIATKDTITDPASALLNMPE